jgi:hypothetical protein
MLDTKHSCFLPDLSIYKLQEHALEMQLILAEDGKKIPHELNNAFFVMLRACEVAEEFYFIHPTLCEDCPVYCWHIDDESLNYAVKVNDTIDEWLREIDFPLYIEAKLKTIVDPKNWGC